MIISKYSKSYDTADGSEQQFADAARPADAHLDASAIAHGSGASARGQANEPSRSGTAHQQWEDDGGPPPPQPPACPLELAAKPTWSVVSLRDLNLAIRLGHWPDNPAHLRRAAAEARRARQTAMDDKALQAASRARAFRNRDRNPWENT
jgi:hypothetical protein